MDTLLSLPKQSINIDSTMANYDFNQGLCLYLDTYFKNKYDNLIIVCIGTDRSTGDSLGPLTGYKLEYAFKKYDHVFVHGTLSKPVHAKNLDACIDFIKETYENPFIIAVDASLGQHERVGHITIGSGPIKPGAGVNKDLPSIGHMHITGIVNMAGFMEYMVLQNTRLHIVMTMADIISRGIQYNVYQLFHDEIKEPSQLH